VLEQRPPFEGFDGERLQVDDPAFQTNGDGMRPIVGGQLGEDVLDVALDGFFGDGELGGDHLVGIPGRDEAEDLDFPNGQGIIGSMLGQFRRYLGHDSLVPRMNEADGLRQFFPQDAFEQVGPSARLERA
jgi:hypothetical protein